ncbi:type II toxin-antitoxin system RelE/ParE family toxin [Brevundimonas sp.]|uniref:type II toxin-antitoxin system RelE/ParE family toxin n=1 Tax=Brevundimonas sp. TaxID=1871086 RepID=UPI003F705D43
MKSLRVIPRVSAIRDAEDATDYYIQEAGDAVAFRFIDALKAAYDRIGDNSGIGSPRLGESVGIPELRTWPVRGFPYVVCYESRPDRIDVWRVLHAQSDIPEHLIQAND